MKYQQGKEFTVIKLFFLVVLVGSMLDARENPFFHETDLEQLPYTSNADRNLPPLKRAAISLPSKARTIEKVTVAYKTLNGAIEEKSIELGNSIDWHLPIFISQNYIISETRRKINTKLVKKIKKQKNKKAKISKKIDNTVQTDNKAYKIIGKRSYITFSSLGRNLKITTANKMMRDFLLVKPHRLVLDFKKGSDVKAYIKKNPDNVFRLIKIGNHEKYFRVVIELDGYYRYKVTQTSDGYILKLQ